MPDERPLALVESGTHGLRLTAVNAPSSRRGSAAGPLPRRCARGLPAASHAPRRARGATQARSPGSRSGAAATGPSRNVDGADGLWIDSTGVAHLFAASRASSPIWRAGSPHSASPPASASPAPSSAAFALARFATTPARPWAIASGEDPRAALAPLPVEALRLDGDTVLLLKRLGLRRIGQLYDLPRAALSRRFRDTRPAKSKARALEIAAGAVLARLDCALGRATEPLAPLAEPPAHLVRCAFAEPLISAEGIDAASRALADELCRALGPPAKAPAASSSASTAPTAPPPRRASA